MRLNDISEGVAGPKNCWPGYRKVGTKPGTGRNAGKRVNDCEKIKESVDIEDTYKGWKFEVETQKEDDRNVTFYSAVSPEGKTHMLPKRATKEQFRQFVDSKTVKEGLTDEVNPADVGEYDREGDMAMGQLKTAEDAAAELRSILDSDENLPEWVQSKITKAVDYLDTARDYMKSKEQDVAEGDAPIDHDWYRKQQERQTRAKQKQQGVAESNNTLNTLVDKTVNALVMAKNKGVRSLPEPAYADDQDLLDFLELHLPDVMDQIPDSEWNNFADAVFAKFFPAAGMAEERTSALSRAVSEAGWGRRYTSYHDELSSRERSEQDYMDQSKRDFKRAELQHELGHEDDPNFERNLRQQQIDRDRGPWYIRIDGKVYKQKGVAKSFDWKRGANNYALAMIKNNPSLQGKVLLTKSAEDK
jgi:hypothetical protein